MIDLPHFETIYGNKRNQRFESELKADSKVKSSLLIFIFPFILSIFCFNFGSAIADEFKNGKYQADKYDHLPLSLKINGPITKQPIEPYISYFEDPTGMETISSIQSPTNLNRFKPLAKPVINFGFTPSVYWFQFSINHPLEEIKQYFLEIDYPMLDKLLVYSISDAGAISILQLGDELAFDQRPIHLRNFTVPLEFLPRETKRIFLQVRSTSNIAFPIRLWSPTHYLKEQHNHQWIMGMFYGIAFGLLAYNLFLFISVKEKAFLFYILHALCSIGYYSVLDGLAFQVFPNAIVWQNISIMVFLCGSHIAGIQFARYYLDTIHNNPIIERICLSLMAVIFIEFIAILFVPTRILSQIIVSVGIFVVIFLLAIGIVRWRQGNPLARIYVVAWTTLLCAAALTVLAVLGIIADFGLSVFGMKIGWITELTLLSLGLGHRINILKTQQVIIQQQALAAKAESKAKGEFLARMSHEIRSPLNGVLGMLKLLSDTKLNNSQRRFITSIENAGDALVEVIDDILNYSKIEAGKMSLERTAFDLERLVSDTIQMFEYKAVENNLRLTVSIDPDIPKQVWGDPARVRQILINLLSNAFKFTKEGYVVVQVKLINVNHNIAGIHFEVADTGIGISLDNQSKLFKSFNQADTSTTREFGGTGLGLVICKELCELMGGKIGVDSIEGHSSCFWFQLPLEIAIQSNKAEANDAAEPNINAFKVLFDSQRHNSNNHNHNNNNNNNNNNDNNDNKNGIALHAHDDLSQQALTDPAPGIEPNTSLDCPTLTNPQINKSHVLVIEDNSINVKVIRGFLSKMDIEPDVAINGKLGVEKYKAASAAYQLILMDCEMPEMDGFEATRIIRQWEIENNWPRCRIIALSAHVVQDFRERAAVVGMDGYLAKPLKYESLKAMVVGKSIRENEKVL